ncbi:MAG: DUF4270 family protein [Bacteroidales bacterium]
MSFRPLGRITILLSASFLFLASCIESDRTIGSNFLPEDFNLEVGIAQFPIAVEMRLADSLQTDFPNYMTIGSFYEPPFGSVTASTAFRIIPMKQGQTFGDAPIVKSIKLSLAVENSSYLEPDQQFIPQNFRVFELLKDIDTTTLYNNSFSHSDLSTQSIEKGGNIFFGGDSLVIELSHQYGNKLVSVTQEESDSLNLFVERYKGLYITCDPVEGESKGGRLNLTLPTNIYLSLTYRHIDQENSIDRDSTISYYISENQPFLNIYNHSSQNLAEQEPGEDLYIEGLAGVRPFVDFNKIKESIESWAESNSIEPDRLAVLKGELRFYFDYPHDYRELNSFPTQLFLATRNPGLYESVRYEPITDISFTSDNGIINRSLQYYSLNISSYLQRVLKGLSPEKMEGYLTPIYQSSDYYSGATYYNVQNYLYYKALLKGPQSDRAPKLILTYSVVP